MNTRILMIASSIGLGVAGLVATFLPNELLGILNAPAVEPLPILVQLLGALYIAFAFANWTAKDSVIGGIYSRPLALGNGLHFTMGALALAKYEFANGFPILLLVVTIIYTVFAICFMYLVFGRGTTVNT